MQLYKLAGANVFVYYLTYIAQIAGLTSDVAMVTSGVQYAVFIIFTDVMGGYHTDVPGGVGGNANIVISVNPGAPANAVILFSYLLIVVYALTLGPV